MAAKTPGEEIPNSPSQVQVVAAGALQSDLGSPSVLDKKRRLATLRRIGSSARRALGLVVRSAESRNVLQASSDGDELPRSPQTLFAGSPCSPGSASATSIIHCGGRSHRTRSLPSPSGSTECSAESTPHPEASLEKGQSLATSQELSSPTAVYAQQSFTPLAPARPRSLLSALLRRPSSPVLPGSHRERERSPGTSAQQPASEPAAGHSSQMLIQIKRGQTSPFSPTCTNLQQHDDVLLKPLPAAHQHSGNHPTRPYPMVSPPDQTCRNSAVVTSRFDVNCLSAPCPNTGALGATLRDAGLIVEAACAGSGALACPAATASLPLSSHVIPIVNAVAQSPQPEPHVPSCSPSGGMVAALHGSLPMCGAIAVTGSPAFGSQPHPSNLATSAPFPARGASLADLTRQKSDPVTPSSQPASMLLATSCSTPAKMLRSCWAMEDYVLQRRLYKGNMSSVYKARCLRSGMPVALKVYFKARVPQNVIHMVMREVSIHLQVTEHKGVLKLYGVFQTDELMVLVMELASRGSLAGVRREVNGGRLSEDQVRQVVLDPLLDSLAFLHVKGICHRDVKPENMLFTADWGFRLADFGVSINLMEERAVTRAGTADYMAPEVERCPLKETPADNKDDLSLAYTTAADVWSIGVLVYELLVGFPPVVEGGLAKDAAGVRMLSFPSSVSPCARDFISVALTHQAEDRPTIYQLRNHPWLLASAAKKSSK